MNQIDKIRDALEAAHLRVDCRLDAIKGDYFQCAIDRDEARFKIRCALYALEDALLEILKEVQ